MVLKVVNKKDGIKHIRYSMGMKIGDSIQHLWGKNHKKCKNQLVFLLCLQLFDFFRYICRVNALTDEQSLGKYYKYHRKRD